MKKRISRGKTFTSKDKPISPERFRRKLSKGLGEIRRHVDSLSISGEGGVIKGVGDLVGRKAEIRFSDTTGESIRPSRNKYFNLVIQRLIDMHDSKNHDYALPDNPFSNFDFATNYLHLHGVALTPADHVDAMKGTKIARLMNFILRKDAEPNYESVEDTELDFVVYWIIGQALELRDTAKQINESSF